MALEIHHGDLFLALTHEPHKLELFVGIADRMGDSGVVRAGIGAHRSILHEVASDKRNSLRFAAADQDFRRREICERLGGGLCAAVRRKFVGGADKRGVGTFRNKRRRPRMRMRTGDEHRFDRHSRLLGNSIPHLFERRIIQVQIIDRQHNRTILSVGDGYAARVQRIENAVRRPAAVVSGKRSSDCRRDIDAGESGLEAGLQRDRADRNNKRKKHFGYHICNTTTIP